MRSLCSRISSLSWHQGRLSQGAVLCAKWLHGEGGTRWASSTDCSAVAPSKPGANCSPRQHGRVTKGPLQQGPMLSTRCRVPC